ncbi:hypothetical protein H0H93_008040 [Arthromyces matolae]|nr:hypothetical protein H0H93_008040 [Arthromyces matolae]
MDVDDDGRRDRPRRSRSPRQRQRRQPSPLRRPSSPRRLPPPHMMARPGPSRDRRQHMPRTRSPSPTRARRSPSPERRHTPLDKGKQPSNEPSLGDDFRLAHLLQRLENTGHAIPGDVSFLQNDFAIEFVGELVDDIELLRKQRQSTLTTLSRVEKRKALPADEFTVEPKKLRHLDGNRTRERALTPALSEPSSSRMSDVAAPIVNFPTPKVDAPSPPTFTFGTATTVTPMVITNHPTPALPAPPSFTTQEAVQEVSMQAPEAITSRPPQVLAVESLPTSQEVGLDASMHAPSSRRKKMRRAVDESTLIDVTFPPILPHQSGPTVLRFSPAMDVPAPPPTYPTKIVPTDPRTPAEYNGIPTSPHTTDGEESDGPPTQHSQQMAINRAEEVTGRISDTIGVFVIPGGTVERLNSFFCGGLGCHFYYSPISNVVFFGYDAQAARDYEETHNQRYPQPELETYKKAMRGFPRNPLELRRLYAHVQNTRARRVDRYIAYRLLGAFYQIASSIDPIHHDRAMALIVDNTRYPSLANPVSPADERTWSVPELTPEHLVARRNNGALGFPTIPHPDSSRPFDLDASARYMLMHARPGKNNESPGLIWDKAFRVHYRSVFGYNLVRALCPNNEARPSVNRQFALLISQPNLYGAVIDAYNERNPHSRFTELTGSSANVQLHRVFLPPTSKHNFTQEDAIRVLMHNRIPRAWIDHAYPFGVAFLDYHFKHPSLLVDAFLEADDSRIARLQQYGTPPAIPDWDGWRELTQDDRFCLHAQHQDDVAAFRTLTDELGYYYPIGYDILQPRLPNRRYPPNFNPTTTATNVAASSSPMVMTNVITGAPTTTPAAIPLPPSPVAANATLHLPNAPPVAETDVEMGA